MESALLDHLEKFARKHKLYLDKKGHRTVRSGKKVTWTDSNGNQHDLDFVLERKGTDSHVGVPVAFIEIAWRRYTKHSRNKAQEIQSAILPLAEKYRGASPFIGVVLAGEFTQGALTQLQSIGFKVLYFPYSSVIKAFNKYKIDADFDENTAESDFRNKIEATRQLLDRSAIAVELMRLNKINVERFFESLANSVSRFVDQVFILPLHSKEFHSNTVSEAIDLLNRYTDSGDSLPVVRYEIIIRYNNGDRIEASFHNKENAVGFLLNYK